MHRSAPVPTLANQGRRLLRRRSAARCGQRRRDRHRPSVRHQRQRHEVGPARAARPQRPPGSAVGAHRREPERSRSRRSRASGASACMQSLKPGGHLAAFAAPRTVSPPRMRPGRSRLRTPRCADVAPGPRLPRNARLPTGRAPASSRRRSRSFSPAGPSTCTLEQNLAKYGTGALNIDACRIRSPRRTARRRPRPRPTHCEPARALARQPAALPRPAMHQRTMRTRLPDRTARRAPPLLLRRQGATPRARGRLRGATPARRADVQDRRTQRASYATPTRSRTSTRPSSRSS